MSYYLFNRKEILQKAIKESQRIDTKTCQKKKKTRLKSTKEKDISNWFGTKKKAIQNKSVLFLLSIRMSEKDTKVWQY